MNGGESGEDAQTGRTRGKLRCGINIVAVFKIKKLFGNGSRDVKNTAKLCVGVQTQDPEKQTGQACVWVCKLGTQETDRPMVRRQLSQ